MDFIALGTESGRWLDVEKYNEDVAEELFIDLIISVRYESLTNRDPLTIIEDARKGLAAMNDWELDPGKREIKYLNSSHDPSDQTVHFARVSVSKRICELIQAQKGQLWISGGTATAQWPSSNGKLLDSSVKVAYNYQ